MVLQCSVGRDETRRRGPVTVPRFTSRLQLLQHAYILVTGSSLTFCELQSYRQSIQFTFCPPDQCSHPVKRLTSGLVHFRSAGQKLTRCLLSAVVKAHFRVRWSEVHFLFADVSSRPHMAARLIFISCPRKQGTVLPVSFTNSHFLSGSSVHFLSAETGLRSSQSGHSSKATPDLSVLAITSWTFLALSCAGFPRYFWTTRVLGSWLGLGRHNW